MVSRSATGVFGVRFCHRALFRLWLFPNSPEASVEASVVGSVVVFGRFGSVVCDPGSVSKYFKKPSVKHNVAVSPDGAALGLAASQGVLNRPPERVCTHK